MKLTGAQILIKCLEKEGVRHVFGLPGGVILPTYDVLYDSKLKLILTKHEQGATHMADGYARATGKPGVCIVTSGPAATNTVTGLATAHMDCIPMVCITGQVVTHAIGSDAFQEVDIVGITRPITKHNFLIKDVKEIARIVREAFYIATTGKPGPVLIDFPVDVSRAMAEFVWPKEVSIRSYQPGIEHPEAAAQIGLAAELIHASKKPVLYVGGGAIISGAEKEVLAFVEKTGIPVTTTILGLGVFPETHPLSLHMLGMHGTHYANYSVQNADVLIGMGARFDDRVTGNIAKFAPHAKIIHIDIDPAAISKTVRVHVPVVCDVKAALAKLSPLVGNKRPEIQPWLDQIAEWKKKFPMKYKTSGSKIHPAYVIEQIGEVTRHQAVMVTGVGQHQMWTAQWYKFIRPRTMLTSGGLGTMGYGLPAAIGAQLGMPEETVVCIDGDGSFQMTMPELATAAFNKVPIKVFLLDNGYYGMVRQWQQLFYKQRYSGSVIGPTNPDFMKLVGAYGILGIRIKEKKEVVPAIKKALAHRGPVVVQCLVAREENVYPMVAAGNALDQIMDMA
ncbi:MAG TPA: biosynthetic-type acetolactate synthase large subunit [Candidatus Omnitrophota bacterium]|nr:biosynthetic-type acetolactate synthase large subunit [Candidatus Omnitrophota bacterium]HPS36147.1 biosynthetic-type acetolactate synthase large subunit [Candidatus Omnitrophota bacterium]